MTTTRFCTCSAGMSWASSPPGGADVLIRLWDEAHSGPGHAPCDADTARKGVKLDRDEVVS